MAKKRSPFSQLPAVDKILVALESDPSLAPLPLAMVKAVVRNQIAALRQEMGTAGSSPGDFDAILGGIKLEINRLYQSRIHPVINATGVIIHTNLGRVPLGATAARRVVEAGLYYNNIELDLQTGERGRRGGFAELALATLIGAEAATVCNNCAGALILILKHLANGARNEVIISRGELVEIGGGFRVPEIMQVSGAKLVEVGATNRTSLQDYRQAINERTGLILKVHRSNFYMEGFTHEPGVEELVALGREFGLPVAQDLGSGAMVPMESLAPIPHEPTAAEALDRGVDVICVSGDKLFGGPQAGIIAGRAGLIAGLKKEPFFRALRCDKLILAGLEQTALEYLDRRGGSEPDVPLLRMLSLTAGELEQRARPMVEALAGCAARVTMGEGVARCGGGTMPKAEIPSVTIDIRPQNLNLKRLAEKLRGLPLPVIGYVAEDCYRLDLRTVMPEQDAALIESLRKVLS